MSEALNVDALAAEMAGGFEDERLNKRLAVTVRRMRKSLRQAYRRYARARSLRARTASCRIHV